MAVPHIISESHIQVFKFYESGAIYEAILMKNHIMRLAGVFSEEEKQKAIDFAYKLCREYPTLITPNPSRYRVWVDVRCPIKFDSGEPLEERANSSMPDKTPKSA